MDIRFLPPDLRRLDEANVELAVASFWLDERPMRGFAALLDWRLGGQLSALLVSGFLRGDEGELLMVPGKPYLPFEKVLLLGLGPRGAFSDEVFQRAVTRMASALEGLRVRRAVVELPGRGVGAIDAERAFTLAMGCLGALPEHDAWWLVEEPSAQKVVEQRARIGKRVASMPEDR